MADAQKNGSINDRYWIRAGIEVIHRDKIVDLNMDRLSFYKMVVDKVVKKSREDKSSSERKVFIDGVRCHWLDSEMKYQQGQFHTHELVPFQIAVKGIEAVNTWLNRNLQESK